MEVVSNQDPAILKEIEGNMQAEASTLIPVDDAYLQLVIHVDSAGDNLPINIASPDNA